MRTEHFITADDGIKTYVLEISPNQTETGPPVFCIHGLTRNHKDFEPIFEFLTGLGRKVYAIDVRGRGKSDYDSNPMNYQPLRYSQDVIGIMTELNIESAVFIGTSMGGLISMVMAMIAPQKVAGIVLNDVGPELNPNGIARIRDYVGLNMHFDTFEEALQTVKSINGRAYPLRENDHEFWTDFTNRIIKKLDNGYEYAYDKEIRQILTIGNPDEPPPSIWPQFEAIGDIPIGLVVGGISDVISNETIEKMKNTKPKLKVAVIQNVGHAPILDEAESKELIKQVIFS